MKPSVLTGILLVAAVTTPARAQTVTSSPSRIVIPNQNDNCNAGDRDTIVTTVRVFSSPPANLFVFPDPTVNWLSAAPTQFTASPAGTTLTVTLRQDRMRKGLQRGFLGIAVPGTQTLLARIPVDVTCVPTPSFSIDQRDLAAEVNAGSPPQTARVIIVRNSDIVPRTTAINLTVFSRSNWLTSAATNIRIAVGTDTSPLDVRIEPSAVSEGTYESYLDVVDTATQSADSVKVTMTVRGAPNTLVVPTATVRFSAAQNGTNPAAQAIAIGSSTGAALSYTASPATQNALPWLLVNGSATSAAGATPGELRISVNIQGLGQGTHRGSVQVTSPGLAAATIPVELVITGSEITVTMVQNAASFTNALAPGAFGVLYGNALAPGTPTSRNWDNAIQNDVLPASLDGVRVTIDGRPAPVQYVANGLINLLVPANVSTGNNIPVVVTNAAGMSNTATATIQASAPAFFMVGGTRYAVAQNFPDYAYVGRPGLIPGGNFRRARPNDVIILYGTGFGPTNPAMNTSSVVRNPLRVTVMPTVTIGGVSATVLDANLTFAGVYQVNVRVPAALRSGDHAVVAQVGSARSLENVLITVEE